MKRTWNLLGGLLSLAVVGVVLVLLVLIFRAQGGQPQVAQQPYPVATATRPALLQPAALTPGPYPPPHTPPVAVTSRPTVQLTATSPIPTPPLPPTAVVMETYISRTLIVAPVGSEPGEIGVFQPPEGRRIVPTCITLDREDNLYVADEYNRRVLKYNPDGQLLATIPLNPPVTVQSMSVGINGELYLLDLAGEFVAQYSQNGDRALIYPKPDWVTDMQSVGLDADGNVEVRALTTGAFLASRHAVVVLGNAAGVFDRQTQLTASKPGIRLGRDLVVGAWRQSADGSEVQLFDLSDNLFLRLPLLRHFGGVSIEEVDNKGHIYLVGGGPIRDDPLVVSKYDPSGRLIAYFTLPLPFPHSWPTKPLAVDNAENVYYLHIEENRVQVIKWTKQ